jgi:hypothetical protein
VPHHEANSVKSMLARSARCLRWVKMRNTHAEQNRSALTLTADVWADMDFRRYGPAADLIDIFHSATRFGGNDFEIVEFCLCFGSEHPNDGPRVTKPRGIRSHDRVYQIPEHF